MSQHPHILQIVKAISMLQKMEQLLEKYNIEIQSSKFLRKNTRNPNNPDGMANKTGYVYYSRDLPHMHLRWMIFYPSNDVNAGDWCFEFSLVFTDNPAMLNSRSLNVGIGFGTELCEIFYINETPEQQTDTVSLHGDSLAQKFQLNECNRRNVSRAQVMEIIEQIVNHFRQFILHSKT